MPYYHVVFTLPAAVADIAYQNKAVIYDLLFKASAETLLTIAADPKHLGARIGITSALHSWGSAMTHHPHIHMIVPGGGISLDGERWVACRPGFFLPVRVLSRLFRRLFLERLLAAHQANRLKFFGNHSALADAQAFATYLAPLRRTEWVVYAKRPFGGPQAVLAYFSRYTHRVAIASSRLIACDRNSVTFRWKDYRAEGREREKVMTLTTAEFIRRFLIHVLPQGFHRIRHYGLLASGKRADNIAQARRLLDVRRHGRGRDADGAKANEPRPLSHPCPCYSGRMMIIERFGAAPRRAIVPRLPSPDQDRHIVVRIGARQTISCSSASPLSTGNDHARPHTTLDSRHVVRPPLRDSDSACRARPTGLIASPVAFQTGIQLTSATDRQHRNPHSV